MANNADSSHTPSNSASSSCGTTHAHNAFADNTPPDDSTADDAESSKGRNVDIPTLVMIVLAAVMIVLAYRRGDDTLVTGLQTAARSFWSILPLLIAVFIVVGFTPAFLPEELIARWLGADSGWKGIALAMGLGAITPGGPFVSYPLVGVLYKAGAGLGPLVTFITAWSLLALSRMPLEFVFVPPRFVFIRVVSALLLPPLAGIIAQVLFSRG